MEMETEIGAVAGARLDKGRGRGRGVKAEQGAQEGQRDEGSHATRGSSTEQRRSEHLLSLPCTFLTALHLSMHALLFSALNPSSLNSNST